MCHCASLYSYGDCYSSIKKNTLCGIPVTVWINGSIRIHSLSICNLCWLHALQTDRLLCCGQGEEGLQEVLQILKDELRLSMALAGKLLDFSLLMGAWAPAIPFPVKKMLMWSQRYVWEVSLSCPGWSIPMDAEEPPAPLINPQSPMPAVSHNGDITEGLAQEILPVASQLLQELSAPYWAWAECPPLHGLLPHY